MPAQIGAKIAVDGEASYKSQIADITAKTKMLASELKLTTTGFDKNTSSQKMAAAMSKTVAAQYENQKAKVAAIATELEKVTKEYGANSKEAMKLQTELNKANTELATMPKSGKEAAEAIKSQGNEAEKAGEKNNKLASILKGVGAALGAAAVAAGKMALDLGKAVVSSYSEFEQLKGGVETLFGTDSTQIVDNANKAFSTAGLSANEYLNTVTSFSASLISSLSGDTAAAAKLADVAIVSMSDNANKMGTDMESLQNAYAGFAKGQYNMLDNLKLGYGGTKEEMERLITDASKMTDVQKELGLTVDEGSMSFDNIVKAIQVMQTSMGIAGATAAESATTIEGSLNSMSSAWQNLITGLGDPNADIGALVGSLSETFGNVVKNITPVIENLVTALPLAFEALMGAISGMLPTLLTTCLGLLEQVLSMLIQSLPMLIPFVVDATMMIVNTLIENLPLLIDAAVQLIVALTQGISQALPTLIPAAVEAIVTIVQSLIGNIGLLVDCALQLIEGLAQGLLVALPQLIEAAPELIIALVDAIIANLPVILKAGWDLIVALVEGIVKALPQIALAAVQIGKNLWDKIKAIDWKELGTNMIEGIKNGIVNAAHRIVDAAKGAVQNALDAAKRLLGIKSPSKVFADEVGKMIPAGVSVGIEKGTPSMVNTLKDSFGQLTDVPAGGSVSKSNTITVNQNFYKERALTAFEIEREARLGMRKVGWSLA